MSNSQLGNGGLTMKINVDRLAVLAGIGSSSNSPGLMSEGKKAAEETEEAYHSEADETDDAMEER